MNTQYIYLLQEREFINSGENIYKIGKTEQKNNKRFFQYPKDSILFFQIICDDCHELEKRIIKLFSLKYKQCKNIGIEYFEGNYNDMINTMFYIKNNMLNDKEIISKDIEIKKNELININNEKQKQKIINLEDCERNKLLKYIDNTMKTELLKIINLEHSERTKIKKIITPESYYLKILEQKIQKTDNDKKFIFIKDIYSDFILTNNNLYNTKKHKRIFTLKSLVNFFETNNSTKKFYRNLYRPFLNDKQQSYSNVLLNYEIK